jgi:hypothetical protein
MAFQADFVYSFSMDGHQALVDQALELYRSLGHFVEQVVEIDELRSDLLIASSQGERWVARCDSNAQITPASVKLFLTHLANYKAQKAAIISTGALTSAAKQLVAGKPLEFIDTATLVSYQEMAQSKQSKSEQTFEEAQIEWGSAGAVKGRRGWRRWIRPLLLGLTLLAITLVVIALAWFGLLPV